jgi:hypothetical protein
MAFLAKSRSATVLVAVVVAASSALLAQNGGPNKHPDHAGIPDARHIIGQSIVATERSLEALQSYIRPSWPNPAPDPPASSIKGFRRASQRSGENAASLALVCYAKSSFLWKDARDPRFDPERNGYGVPFTSLVRGQLSFW